MEKPVTLDAPLTSLPGIGPQRAALFARLNVRTVGELLRLYPRAYEDRTRLVSIASLEAGTPACFEAAVVTTPRTNRIPKPGSRMLEVTKFTVADDTGRLNLTFFNAAHSAGALRVGERYCFYGVLTGDFAAYGMTNPLFEPCDGPAHVTRRILPVYPLTAGLTNSMVLRAQAQAVSRCAGLLPETLPPERCGATVCAAAEACREIHRFHVGRRAGAGRSAVPVFEEFFLFRRACHRAQPPHGSLLPGMADGAYAVLCRPPLPPDGRTAACRGRHLRRRAHRPPHEPPCAGRCWQRQDDGRRRGCLSRCKKRRADRNCLPWDGDPGPPAF